jgi:hypothetical protein
MRPHNKHPKNNFVQEKAMPPLGAAAAGAEAAAAPLLLDPSEIAGGAPPRTSPL